MSSISNPDSSNIPVGKPFEVDAEYPGTAVQRLRAVHARVAQLTRSQLDADWPSVRRSLLWAGNPSTELTIDSAPPSPLPV